MVDVSVVEALVIDAIEGNASNDQYLVFDSSESNAYDAQCFGHLMPLMTNVFCI